MKYSHRDINPKIDKLMVKMGFMSRENGVYWHKYFGDEVLFDLTASDNTVSAIMFHVFKTAVKYGEDQKLDDIQKMLGLNNRTPND